MTLAALTHIPIRQYTERLAWTASLVTLMERVTTGVGLALQTVHGTTALMTDITQDMESPAPAAVPRGGKVTTGAEPAMAGATARTGARATDCLIDPFVSDPANLCTDKLFLFCIYSNIFSLKSFVF